MTDASRSAEDARAPTAEPAASPPPDSLATDLSPVGRPRRAYPLALPRTFSALRHRNFRLYWFGQIVSLSGTWMQTTAQSWLIYELTLSPLTLGVLSFASQLPTLIFSLFAGVLADRVNKRSALILTQSLAMIQAFVLAALVLSGRIQAWQVIALALVLGIINAFDNPIRQSFIPELVPRTDMMNAIALGASAFNGARIVGPALGGAIVAAIGAGGAFFLNALSFLAVLIGLLMMRVTPRPPRAQRDSMWTSLREGVGYIRDDRNVLTLLLMAMMVGIFGMPYATLMPVMAADVLGLGAGGYGLLLSATGVGALAGALMLASLGDFQHKGWLVTVGDWAFPLTLLLFSVSRSLWVSVVVLAGLGLFLIIRNATTNTLLQTAVPDHLRGRVISVYMLMFIGMDALRAAHRWLAAVQRAHRALW
ncbi:MAG: MFS transporter [Anaerolineae bacterium]|nr:MFS transporter [Anaerolineae bacterium]